MNETDVRTLTLEARTILEAEIRALLEGVYGFHEDGAFEPVEALPAIAASPEVRKTRERLEERLREEAAVGTHTVEAREKLVREVGFTHLNRLVAFKMLEARRL